MSRRPALRTATAVATLTLLAGCSDGPADAPDAAPETVTSSAPPDPTNSPTHAPTPEEVDALPPVRNATSLPALMREELRGGSIRRERTQLTTDAYTLSLIHI